MNESDDRIASVLCSNRIVNCSIMRNSMPHSTRFDDRPAATATVQVDNDRCTVTEWRFSPGSHTGWHRHQMDYVVVPMTTGELLIDTGADTIRNPLIAGQAYGRRQGVEHDVINDNPTEFVFIEIEMKDANS
jgi:quercetin dioxygenase-like cupin family protein